MKTENRNILIIDQLLEKELKKKERRKRSKEKRRQDAIAFWELQHAIAEAEIRDFVQKRGW